MFNTLRKQLASKESGLLACVVSGEASSRLAARRTSRYTARSAMCVLRLSRAVAAGWLVQREYATGSWLHGVSTSFEASKKAISSVLHTEVRRVFTRLHSATEKLPHQRPPPAPPRPPHAPSHW
jgi:hypothetical protein